MNYCSHNDSQVKEMTNEWALHKGIRTRIIHLTVKIRNLQKYRAIELPNLNSRFL